MAVNETIVTGRKFRKLTDAASKTWQRISFWHKASDCEFNDGKTAEQKLGAIKGITTDLNVTVPGYAADATRVSELNNSLGGIKFAKDSSGNWGYYEAGADSVTPFKGNIAIIKNKPTYPGWTYTIEQSGYFMYLSSINISSPIFKKSFTLNGVEIKCNNSYDKPLNNDTWILGFNEPIKVKKGDVITFVPALTTAYPGILLMC